MSVEEAKRVSAAFTGGAFVPPPRTITDIEKLLEPDPGGNFSLNNRRLAADVEVSMTGEPVTVTADDIRNIARAMKADLAADVFLGARANEKLVFSYAHPLFWAPFALVGDGG
jgi:hypothetical protein